MDSDDSDAYFQRILRSLKSYKHDAHHRLASKRQSLIKCSVDHQSMLMSQGYGAVLENVTKCIEANQNVLDAILDEANADNVADQATSSETEVKTHLLDFLRIQSLFAQVVREWSLEGMEERKESFGTLINQLLDLCPDPEERANKTVFFPGAGLARLPFEVAKLGFQALTNEQDLLRLFTSSFIMNRCQRSHNFRIYPWLDDFTNRLSSSNFTKPVSFPDINPHDRPDQFVLESLPGDFVEISKDSDLLQSSDYVVTSFFLDAGPNPLDIIEGIKRILKPGGTWINLGSLSFAYATVPDEPQVTMSWEVLQKCILSYGFSFAKVKADLTCRYCDSSSHSMMKSVYQCPFFVCILT